ncbi:MAG TPA: HD domain-containing protein [Thermomicrobiales bacterium]|nr:HD domain-containing protein [Thermomicrobiales bacterium]
MTVEQWMANDEAGIQQFWELALALKRVRRQGWIDRGVDAPESVADHSWGVALLAWLASHGRADLDRNRVLLLGLAHDLPEAIAGDATPFDDTRDAGRRIDARRFLELPAYSAAALRGKRDEEARALAELISGLPRGVAEELRAAWIEYERQETVEARFVKQIDKLETLLQARAYGAAQPELIIESFRLGAQRDVSDPALRRIARLDEPEPGG